MKKCALLLGLLLGTLVVRSQDESRLLRFPAISGNKIVFTYAGDLYQVDRTGGTARKLTNDIGYEMFARFAPDGKTLAFTGQYDGNTEVYTMPAEGGVPKRITYTATLGRDDISDRMGPNNIVMTWTNDGKNVVYRSRKKSFNDFKGQLFTAPVTGGLSGELPLPCGGFCSYSPDGSKLAYNRVFREFRTWKYYKGGMADDIWIYDFASKKVENITNNANQDIIPMWAGNKIYYLSDRDRTMNLFSYDITTKQTKKVTDFKEYDIKFPSLGNDAIVFENGGSVYVFDLKTEKAEKVNIKIADDMNSGRSELIDASRFIQSSGISPDGKRIVLGARGDIFTLPAKTGVTRNLTQSPGAHDRNPAWSPDGKYVAFISDLNGEDEIYIIAQDGSSKAQQITKGGNNYKYAFQWSPDSKKILWSDRKQRLLYIDIETKTEKIIESSNEGEYRDFTWSPNSKYVAYVKPKQDEQSRIFIYELESGKSNAVTEGWYDSNRPAFSSDGKFLFFASNRDFNPIYSWTEWNHAYVDMTRIYFVTLSKDTKNPLAPVDDEVTLKSDTAKKEKAKGDNSVKIDFEGIEQRIIVIPGDASNYWNLACSGDVLYYFKQSVGDEKAGMKMFDLKDKKENDLGSCNNFKISADGKKMLVSGSGKNYVIDCPRSKMDLKDAVDQSNMEVLVNLKEEWKQIFYESWRQMRDCFYATNMHEVNWDKMKKKYEVLLPYVNQRADLTYLIGEMIGELSTGHAYTGGGDKPEPKKIKLGLLGAELSRHASGYYQINTILKGENWDPALRSPLTEVGVKAYPGNYILAVNGKSVKDVNDIYELLVNTADIQVELTLNSMPSEIGSWKQIVVPIADESKLYYFNWVRSNIEKVNKATSGKVGYIHIPDMGVEGLNEFAKYYYPQFNKTALIIDDRGNGGGNVSPMIAERLARQPIIMKAMRNNTGSPSPFDFVQGPKVLLMDNYSASDGDLFPYRFQKMKLGKTIGVRTWGGVVGIRGSYPFIDGGYLNKPEFAHYDLEGKNWVIEGYGVDPEIVIDNDPAKEYAGNDEQLNKAIEQILEALKSFKPYETNPPKFPDKSK